MRGKHPLGSRLGKLRVAHNTGLSDGPHLQAPPLPFVHDFKKKNTFYHEVLHIDRTDTMTTIKINSFLNEACSSAGIRLDNDELVELNKALRTVRTLNKTKAKALVDDPYLVQFGQHSIGIRWYGENHPSGVTATFALNPNSTGRIYYPLDENEISQLVHLLALDE